MIQLELSYKTSTIDQHKYLTTTKGWMLQLVLTYDKTKKVHSISKQSCKFKQEINMHQSEENDTNTSTKQASNIKKTVKTEGLKQIKQNWERKPLHGKYPLRSQKAGVDQRNTNQWLCSAGLKAETEGFIMAALNQSQNYKKWC